MYSLLHHNTFGIDAKCENFIEYATVEELQELLPSLRGKRWLQIGGGSNLLFVHDFQGTVLHSLIKGDSEVKRTDRKVWLRVGAGENWDEWVGRCVSLGYYGLENLSYIPGEVGASAVQNIGAYGKEVGSYIEQVEAIDVATGNPRVFQREECNYGYRSSSFKHELRGQFIVTYVTYCLDLQFKPNLDYGVIRSELQQRSMQTDTLTAQALRNLIIDVRRSKLPEPSELGSAGSFFMNPIVSEEIFHSLLKEYPDMPHYKVGNGVKIPAGWLIERCGWKGKSKGPVGVYSKQALVLVNLGGATGTDVVELSEAICKDVQSRFGITIQPEANFIY